jgi:hypothetical protein
MDTLIAQGTASSLERIGEYQAQFEENSAGYLQIQLRSAVAGDAIGWLRDKLSTLGVVKGDVIVEGSIVRINFQTKIAPLVLIAAAIAACIVIVALVVAWKLYKLSPLAAVGISAGIVILIAALCLLAVVLITKFGGRVSAGPISASGG